MLVLVVVGGGGRGAGGGGGGNGVLNKRETYLSEFCAHEDEENQSQELARRLHLLPPVCVRVDQRSHMQIESLCVPPAQQSSPPASDVARSLGYFFVTIIITTIIIIITSLLSDPPQTCSGEMRLAESSLGIFQFISEPVLGASPLSALSSLAALIYRRGALCSASGLKARRRDPVPG